MVVDLVLFVALIRQGLLLVEVVVLGEGDRVLLADPVQELGKVVFLDAGAWFVDRFPGEFAERAGDGWAVSESGAAQGLLALFVGIFLRVEFECLPCFDACKVHLCVDDAVVSLF